MTDAETRRLVEDAMQRTVAQAQRLASLIVYSDVDPEGVVDAALGALCLQTTAGTLWQKSTALGTLTGWQART